MLCIKTFMEKDLDVFVCLVSEEEFSNVVGKFPSVYALANRSGAVITSASNVSFLQIRLSESSVK